MSHHALRALYRIYAGRLLQIVIGGGQKHETAWLAQVVLSLLAQQEQPIRQGLPFDTLCSYNYKQLRALRRKSNLLLLCF